LEIKLDVLVVLLLKEAIFYHKHLMVKVHNGKRNMNKLLCKVKMKLWNTSIVAHLAINMFAIIVSTKMKDYASNAPPRQEIVVAKTRADAMKRNIDSAEQTATV
jgi:hypothetical protein